MEPATKNLAVFIDFENCARAPAFDLNILMSRLKERGRLLIRRAYGDWGRFASQKRALAEASVSLIELPSHGGKGREREKERERERERERESDREKVKK